MRRPAPGNPIAAVGRSWGHFRRRPVGTQVRTASTVLVIVAVVAVWVGSAPSAPPPATAAVPTGGPVPVARADTSSRGVTAGQINVVFPVVALDTLAGQEGFARDAEYGEQRQAIDLFVGGINRAGGINGRRIDPIVVPYDPSSESGMRALCKTWTEGTPAAFAVIDGLGAWTGDSQLCIAQEGHTPFIGQWTTVTDWTDLGSPYLWWTGPDQASVLRAVVGWGVGSGLLGRGRTVGVIAGDRASDQAALDQVLLPALRRAGVTPVVATIAAGTSETATTDSQAPLIVQRFRTAGVDSVIPLIPFNAFFPVLQAETDQRYFPRLLLSDYESSIEASLGLLPVPYATALDGQEGVTTETLGGIDDDRPQSEGGYDPGLHSCWAQWHRAYPGIPPGNLSDFIEEQGPVALWCQAIRLFAVAAAAAGPHLDRRTFVTALAGIRGLPGTVTPVLSYGPARRSGPTTYQVVRLHVNVPPSSSCRMPQNRIPQMTCWVQVRPFAPLPGP